jgi:hypothetical protein
MYPTLPGFCNEMSAMLARLLAYVGAIVVLGILVAKMCGLPRVEAAVEPLAPRGWITVERPHRAFALFLPELPSELEPSYAIHRHPAGGGRMDTMSWGDAQSAGSRLLIEIYRPGSELKRFADPVSAILAQAADLGAVRSPKPAAALDSKFGPVAVVDFAARRDDRVRHCLGFARSFEEPRLQIAGWYCKSDDEIVDGRLVTCALDRLAVIAAGSDPKLAELFAQAELKRKFCGRRPPLRGATLKRADWLAAARDPKLRGRVAAR